jgi:ABC-2 type transport system permease protein
VPALVSPFAGVFYPLSTLPHWMQYICRALPPSYVFENVRAIVAGRPASMPALTIGISLAVIDVVVACWIFARVYRYSVQTGLIARYSAESVS